LYEDCSEALKVAKEVNTILKSIRDPAVRKPLKRQIESFDLNVSSYAIDTSFWLIKMIFWCR